MKRQNQDKSGTNSFANAVTGFVFLGCLSSFLTPEVSANITGNDQQLYNPSASIYDYATVKSSKVLEPGRFSLGLFGDYATNTLPYEDSSGKASITKINDSLLSAQLGANYGLVERLEVGIVLPVILRQSVGSESFHGELTSTGLTEFRLHAKVFLLNIDSIAISGLGTLNFNQMQANPYMGSKSNLMYSTEIIAEYFFDIYSFASNLGYKWRSGIDANAESQGLSGLSNQVLYSFAFAADLQSISHKVVWEIYGAQTRGSTSNYLNRSRSSRETLLNFKKQLNPNLFINYGFGTELGQGVGSADLRLFSGLQYTIQTPPLMSLNASLPANEPPPKETIVLSDLFFEYNSARLSTKNNSMNAIDEIGLKLSQKKEFNKIIIEGHTCDLGNDRANLVLSAKRAAAIKKYLIKKYHLPSGAIIASGKGERNPIAPNTSEEGREKNRRVEFKIY